MEDILKKIHGDFIKLPEDEVRRNKQILESIVQTLIEKMRSKDVLFNAMFRRVFYGGSFYDGLRVGKPREFDLDLLLDIPTLSKPKLSESDKPAFVHLQLQELNAWLRQPEAKPAYDTFGTLLFDNEMFLSVDKVFNWMKSIIDKCMNDFTLLGNDWRTVENDTGFFKIRISRRKKPAITLTVNFSGVEMDIDLVTCFVFSERDNWLDGFRENPCKDKPEFFIVPKDSEEPERMFASERYWRLSFQEQERKLLKGKERLKSAIRLLKKLGRTLQQEPTIHSYYIKTFFLNLVDQKELSFWNLPLSRVFINCLAEYQQAIQNGEIWYYWDPFYNLIGNVPRATLENFSNRLGRIIKEIDNNPQAIVEYLLDATERAEYFSDTPRPLPLVTSMPNREVEVPEKDIQYVHHMMLDQEAELPERNVQYVHHYYHRMPDREVELPERDIQYEDHLVSEPRVPQRNSQQPQQSNCTII